MLSPEDFTAVEDFKGLENNSEEASSQLSPSDYRLVAAEQNVDLGGIGFTYSPNEGNSRNSMENQSEKEIPKFSAPRVENTKRASPPSNHSKTSQFSKTFQLLKTKEVNNLLREYEDIFHNGIRETQFLLEENKCELSSKEREIENEIEEEFREVVSRLERKKNEILNETRIKIHELHSSLENYSQQVKQCESVISERIQVVTAFKNFVASCESEEEDFIREFNEFVRLIEDPKSLRAEMMKVQGRLKKFTIGVNYEGLIQHIEGLGCIQLDVENLKSSFREVERNSGRESRVRVSRGEDEFIGKNRLYNGGLNARPKLEKSEFGLFEFIPPWSISNSNSKSNFHNSSHFVKPHFHMQIPTRQPSPSSTAFLSPSRLPSHDKSFLNFSHSSSSRIENRLFQQKKSFVKAMGSYRSVLADLKSSSKKSSTRRRL